MYGTICYVADKNECVRKYKKFLGTYKLRKYNDKETGLGAVTFIVQMD